MGCRRTIGTTFWRTRCAIAAATGWSIPPSYAAGVTIGRSATKGDPPVCLTYRRTASVTVWWSVLTSTCGDAELADPPRRSTDSGRSFAGRITLPRRRIPLRSRRSDKPLTRQHPGRPRPAVRTTTVADNGTSPQPPPTENHPPHWSPCMQPLAGGSTPDRVKPKHQTVDNQNKCSILTLSGTPGAGAGLGSAPPRPARDQPSSSSQATLPEDRPRRSSARLGHSRSPIRPSTRRMGSQRKGVANAPH